MQRLQVLPPLPEALLRGDQPGIQENRDNLRGPGPGEEGLRAVHQGNALDRPALRRRTRRRTQGVLRHQGHPQTAAPGHPRRGGQEQLQGGRLQLEGGRRIREMVAA